MVLKKSLNPPKKCTIFFLTVDAAAPLQEAAVVGLNFPDSYYTELLETYTKKRAYFLKGLDEIGLKHNSANG